MSSERRKEVVGGDMSGVLRSPSCSQQPPVRLAHSVSKGFRLAEELEVRGLGMGGSRHPGGSWHFESSPSTCPFLLTYLSFSVLVLSFKTMKNKRHSLGCT